MMIMIIIIILMITIMIITKMMIIILINSINMKHNKCHVRYNDSCSIQRGGPGGARLRRRAAEGGPGGAAPGPRK